MPRLRHWMRSRVVDCTRRFALEIAGGVGCGGKAAAELPHTKVGWAVLQSARADCSMVRAARASRVGRLMLARIYFGSLAARISTLEMLGGLEKSSPALAIR